MLQRVFSSRRQRSHSGSTDAVAQPRRRSSSSGTRRRQRTRGNGSRRRRTLFRSSSTPGGHSSLAMTRTTIDHALGSDFLEPSSLFGIEPLDSLQEIGSRSWDDIGVLPTRRSFGDETSLIRGDGGAVGGYHSGTHLRKQVLEVLFPEQSQSRTCGAAAGAAAEKIGDESLGSSSSTTTCTICLEVIQPEESVLISGNCHHIYHHKCGLDWLQNSQECPNCRTCMYEREAYDAIESALWMEQREQAEQTSLSSVARREMEHELSLLGITSPNVAWTPQSFDDMGRQTANVAFCRNSFWHIGDHNDNDEDHGEPAGLGSSSDSADLDEAANHPPPSEGSTTAAAAGSTWSSGDQERDGPFLFHDPSLSGSTRSGYTSPPYLAPMTLDTFSSPSRRDPFLHHQAARRSRFADPISASAPLPNERYRVAHRSAALGHGGAGTRSSRADDLLLQENLSGWQRSSGSWQRRRKYHEEERRRVLANRSRTTAY